MAKWEVVIRKQETYTVDAEDRESARRKIRRDDVFPEMTQSHILRTDRVEEDDSGTAG